MRHVLITGKPRVGKTSLIKELIPHLTSYGGFYTQEICENDKRVGFEIITLDGKMGLLAKKGLKSEFRLGSYGIYLKDLEGIGIKAVEDAIRDKDFIVIDEIGKMELYSEEFRDIVLKALDSGKRLLGVIHIDDIPFLRQIKSRKDILLLELTPDNHRDILEQVKKELLKSY